ncbi:MAG: hypothetical protein O3B87_04815 [bacterium]|nr:hypothetical protein [bacterium]
MLTDDDIIRLTTAFSKIFATKDDLKILEEKVDRIEEKIDTLAKEVVDYTQAHFGAHQKVLGDHA